MKSELEQQALQLANITTNLSQCCHAKEFEIFHQTGLTASEGHVLLTVAEAGAATPSAVAAQLGVGRSRLTPLVQGLVDKGFLIRRESPRDRRVRDLRLSSAGEDVARQAADYRMSFHLRLLESFSDDERRRLLDMLAALHERMTMLRRGMNSTSLTPAAMSAE